MNQNIILTTDYHDQNCVIRWLDEATGKEQLYKIATDAKQLSDLVARAEAVAKPRGGGVVWSKRRGNKIGRLVVARMLLRSIWRMLRKGEGFAPTAPAETKENNKK